MSCDFLALSNTSIAQLQPYQTGKPIEELQRELGLSDIVKLASNENPCGVSKKVAQAISEHISGLTRYPDGAAFELKKAIANKHHVRSEQITLGNGSNDVLNLLGYCFLNPSVEVVYSQHTFVAYPIISAITGAKVIEVPARDFGHDIDAMLAAINDKTRMVFIANPNNPTGTWLGHQAMQQFMQQVPEHVIVVLDEAYAEYIDGVDYANGLALQKQFANLVITRTFSKAYGLAGLRVGYSISSAQIADVLNRVREPFNVNTLAQVAAIAALADEDYVRQSIALNNAGRSQIERGLTALGLSFIVSQGNFICFDTQRNAPEVYQALLQLGVIVRPVVGYGLPTHLRVSIGLAEENARFLTALAQVLSAC